MFFFGEEGRKNETCLTFCLPFVWLAVWPLCAIAELGCVFKGSVDRGDLLSGIAFPWTLWMCCAPIVLASVGWFSFCVGGRSG